MIRPYEKKDYETLCSWWKDWDWQPVGEHFLPSIGIVCDEMAAGFLYLTNSPISWLEWIVSDKKAPAIVRSKSVDEVVKALCSIAKANGSTAVFTSTNKDSLEKRLAHHGFVAGDRGVTQLFKGLGD